MTQQGNKQPGVMQKDLSALLFGSVPKPARTACWSLFFWGILKIAGTSSAASGHDA